MIARLAKGVLPANTQIQKDALLALHKSATVFVSYIASKYVCPAISLGTIHAQNFLQVLIVLQSLHLCSSNENAQSGGKKTIAPQDVFNALKDCEFEDFIPRLEAELKSTFATPPLD